MMTAYKRSIVAALAFSYAATIPSLGIPDSASRCRENMSSISDQLWSDALDFKRRDSGIFTRMHTPSVEILTPLLADGFELADFEFQRGDLYISTFIHESDDRDPAIIVHGSNVPPVHLDYLGFLYLNSLIDVMAERNLDSATHMVPIRSVAVAGDSNIERSFETQELQVFSVRQGAEIHGSVRSRRTGETVIESRVPYTACSIQ